MISFKWETQKEVGCGIPDGSTTKKLPENQDQKRKKTLYGMTDLDVRGGKGRGGMNS